MRIILPILFFFSIQSYASDYWFPERLHMQEVDSIRCYIKEHLKEFHLDYPGQWAVVTANHQTRAQAPNGNKWEASYQENLYVTFITLFPNNELKAIDQVLKLSTLAVVQTLKEYELPARIKFPNDVFIGHNKISSCFCETIPMGSEEFCYLLIDIAINVNTPPEEIAIIPSAATSMQIESAGNQFDVERILQQISFHLKGHIDHFVEENIHPKQIEMLNNSLAFREEMVEVEIRPNVMIRGKFLGLDEDE